MDLDDVDVSRWVLEYLLSDRNKLSVAKQFVAVAPLSNHDWRLKKILLLRTIESEIFDEASVSETILDSLESIEVLDRGHGIPITESMRAAYCAVATDLTVKYLVCFEGKPCGKYMEAVDRIWRGRVSVLEESELASAALKERRDEVEAAIWDMTVSNKLACLNSRCDALRLVAAYVKEALAVLDPPFINLAAACQQEEAHDITDNNGQISETSRSMTHGQVQIIDAEDVGISSAQVRKVHQELMSSAVALQSVVTDPLPHALRICEDVRSELEMRHVDHVCHPIQKENDATNLFVDEGKGAENAPTEDVCPRNLSCSYQSNVCRAGLMERNSTSCTYEWDDSLGMSPERTNSKRRLHLPSPKKIAVSPLMKFVDKKISKRRPVVRWSLQEEDTLRTGVQKFGRGNWKMILDAYRDVFGARTSVDLKNKWTSMIK